MKLGKSMALMAIGAGAVLAYQKYNKPIKKKVESMVNNTTKKVKNANDKLENMM